MKTLFKILWIAALAAVLLFAVGRYGWRAVGFAACDDPSGNYVESVAVQDGSVQIVGGAADSFSAYVGCIHALSDGKLYLGVKHNALLGFVQRIGAFSITVPTNGQTVSEVYLKGGGGERLIWAKAGGAPASRPEEQPPSAEAGMTADERIVQASYPFDGADAENDLCAVVFLGYDEASAKEAVARLCAEYEVLHELFSAGDIATFDANGGEQYLILPKYNGTVITVNEVALDDGGTLRAEGDAVTTQSLLRIYANYSDIVPSAEITVRFGEQSITFHPFISLEDGNIAAVDGAYTRMG